MVPSRWTRSTPRYIPTFQRLREFIRRHAIFRYEILYKDEELEVRCIITSNDGDLGFIT